MPPSGGGGRTHRLVAAGAVCLLAAWGSAQVPLVHWTFDGGTATNCGSGGAAYDATLSGAVAFTDGIDGGGLRFLGGSQGYAALPYTFGDQGTVAFWYNPARFYDYNSLFDNSINLDKWEMWIQGATGTVRFRINRENQADFTFATLSSQYNGTNAWYHFAVTWDRNAATNHARLYINGAERQAAEITAWDAPGNTVYFGGHTGNTPAEGVMDDVRVYDTPLTAVQIQAVHAEIAAKAPVVHVAFDGAVTNSGTGGPRYDAVLHGDPAYTNGVNDKGQALVLDGVDDFAAVPYRLSVSGTVALWYYVPGPWYAYNSVFDNALSPQDYECWIDQWGLVNFRSRGSVTQYNLGSTGSNRWHHIVGTWDALSSNTVLYVNGVLRGRIANTMPVAGTQFYVGGGNADNTYGRGIASDLQIFDTPLSSNRVVEIYNELGQRGGLVAYLPFDGTAEDVAGSNAVVVTGSPVFVNGQIGKALSYEPAVTPGNGGSRVSVSNVLGSSVGTIALWFYARGPWYNYHPVMDNAVDTEWWESWIYEDGRLAIRVSNRSGGGTINSYNLNNLRGPDNWYHIAFTWDRAAQQTRLYVDGVQRATAATLTDAGWVDPDPTLNIGSLHAANKAANGIWDEVRVYDRALTAAEIEALTVIPPPPPPRGTLVMVQ
jgi:hypothetical protein